MERIRIFTIIGLVAFLIGCNSRNAKNVPAKTEPDKNAMLVQNAKVVAEKDDNANPDSNFINEAINSGYVEVELGDYAQQKAGNKRVKLFGALMVRDHMRADDQLRNIINSKHLDIPASMNKEHQDMVKNLEQKSGDDFDKAYIDTMVDDHGKDIETFKKEAENGKDDQFKSYAAKIIPILVVHQDSAKKIQSVLKEVKTKKK